MALALDDHPHAAAVLGAALTAGPSHAYLLGGPAGTGKRETARSFAAELLSAGSKDPDNARLRVMHGSHPDLTWVAPSGAHEMLRKDVSDAVVAAATRTPFESARRVFVLERVDTMNDEAANTLLKTLEEPADYVVLLLLSDRPSQVLATIASRCQVVRFDAPTPEAIAARLEADGTDAAEALACARLALGDAERARLLASPAGEPLRKSGEALARAPLHGRAHRDKPWRELLVAGAEQAAGVRAAMEADRDAELAVTPKKEQRRKTTEWEERIKRAERRTRTAGVDQALQLAALWLRDLACVAAGAADLAHNADRADALAHDARDRRSSDLREAVALVEETRSRFALNVSEELALEALAYRLEARLA